MALHECRQEGVIEGLQTEVGRLRDKQETDHTSLTTLQSDLGHNGTDHGRIREEQGRFIKDEFKPLKDFVWGDVKTNTQWVTQFRANFRQIVLGLVLTALTALGGLLLQLYTLRQQLQQQPQNPPALQREVR